MVSSIISTYLGNQSFYWEVLENLDRVVVQPLFVLHNTNNFSAWLYNSACSVFDFESSSSSATLFLDSFQLKLAKILLFIVVTNFILIFFFWRSYGKKITDKFLQPSDSSKLIEELKNSINELKLPKEHSPRL